MQPKVSMVIPCYNKSKWIGNMFDSIMSQKWNNIELILVNDGSTDGTREKITEYEPKFSARGFEVVIIDQENQGVAMAVRNGLMRVTGEFVCQVDADDELDSEYVSTMAGWLEQNPDEDWIICDAMTVPADFEGSPFLKRNYIAKPRKYPYKLFESVILQRILCAQWLNLFRTKYLKKCQVAENFSVIPNITQEPQILLPAIIGGAQPVFLRRALYHFYNRVGSITQTAKDSGEASAEYISQYARLISATLSKYDKLDTYTRSLISVYETHERYHYARLSQSFSNEYEYINEMLQVIEKSNLLETQPSLKAAKSAGSEILYRYFSNTIIGYPSGRAKLSRKHGGRIIAYAAFGAAAKTIMHGLLNSDICPDLFWDIAAEPNNQIEGIAINRPAFESLKQNDMVLVLLKDLNKAQDVKESLELTAARENIWYYYDIQDHLVDYYFYEGM